MSKTIDQRIVEMQFDNKQFEAGIKTTQSSLDKFKSALNFQGATKGLNDVSSAANKVNFNPLASSVDAIGVKFSALQVAATTALVNITNQAVNTGKQMISALTIDPIMSGFSEYEIKMNSIQTIMSNTASKGTTMADVTRVINDLNTYADKTIYNFAEMTRNIGTFTAAGVELEVAASAIQGIANLAAASGSNSQQASTAMYQLSQALATGTVKLMDWNSVVNAGMGGQLFQDALKETAREYGVAIDDIIAQNGSFRDSLQEEWLSADILNATLQKFTVEGAKDYSRSMIEMGHWTQEQADALIAEAQSMEDAATKVKTFTQLWSTLTEAAQSGWSQSWETIIGDFEEAKEFLTEINDAVGGLINDSADARNELLIAGLGTGWDQFLSQGIADAAGYQSKIEEVARTHIENFDEMIEENGGFQKSLKEGWLTADIMTESLTKLVDETRNLSDEEIEARGYTLDQVQALRDLERQVKNGSISVEEFANNMDMISGRENLIQALRNSFEALMSVMNPISEAFKSVFSVNADQVYSMTEAIRDFTERLILSTDAQEKLKTTAKGVFDILGLIANIVKNGLNIVFGALGRVIGVVDGDILSFTATIGESLSAFAEWVQSSSVLTNVFATIVNGISSAIIGIRDFVVYIYELETVQNILMKIGEFFGDMYEAIQDPLSGVMDIFDVFLLRLNLLSMTGQLSLEQIVDAVISFVQNVYRYLFKTEGTFDGVSTTFSDFVENVKKWFGEAGESLDWLGDKFATVGEYILTNVRENWGSIVAMLIGIGIIKFLYDMAQFMDRLNPFAGFADVLEETAGLLSALSGQIKATQLLTIAQAIAVLAGAVVALALVPHDRLWEAVGVLAVLAVILGALGFALSKFGAGGALTNIASIGAIVGLAAGLWLVAQALKSITELDSEGLKHAVSSLISMTIVMLGALILLGKFSGQFAADAAGILAVAAAMWIMAKALQQMAAINPRDIGKALGVFTALLVGLVVFSLASKSLSMGTAASILAIVIAFNLILGIIRRIGDMDLSGIRTQATELIMILGLIAGLMLASKLAGNATRDAGIYILMISGAVWLIAHSMKILAGFEKGELLKAELAVLGIAIIYGGLIFLFKYIKGAGKNAKSLGVMLIAISAAILLIVASIYALSFLTPAQLAKGLSAITIIGLVFMGLIAASKLANNGQQVSKNIMTMTIAIVAITVALIALSFIDPKKLYSAVGAITIIIGMFSLLMYTTKFVNKKVIGTLIVMTLAMIIMTGLLLIMEIMKTDNAIKNATALGVLLLTFSTSLAIVSKTGKKLNMTTIINTLIAMSIVALALGALLYLLQWLDPVQATGVAIAMGIFLNVFAASLYILRASKKGISFTKDMGMLMSTLGSMLIVAAALGLILFALQGLDPTQAIGVATAMGIFLNTFSSALYILRASGKGKGISFTKDMGMLMATLGSMVIVAAALGAILWALQGLNPTQAIGMAIALGIFLNTFASALLILSLAKGLNPAKIVPTILAMTVVTFLLGEILRRVRDLNPAQAIGMAIALGIFLNLMAIAMIPIGVASVIPTLLTGTAALLIMTIAVGILAGVLWLLRDLNPAQTTPMAKSLGELILILSIALLPLSMVGVFGLYALAGVGILAALIVAIGVLLLSLGAISSNWDNAQTFIDAGIPMLEAIGEGIGRFIGGIVSGGIESVLSAMPQWGTYLSEFMENAQGFIIGLGDIPDNILDSALNLSAAVLAITAADFISNLTTVPWGDGPLTSFGKELEGFGGYLATFASETAGIDAADMADIGAGVNNLAQAFAVLVGGDFLSKFTGDNTLDGFGQELALFGPSLKTFSDAAANVNVDNVANASEAAIIAMDMAKHAPNEGGWLGSIMGENGLGAFGEGLVSFGEDLVIYADEVDGLKVDAIENSATAATKLIEMANKIQNEGGVAAELFGDNTLSKFAAGLIPFGTKLVTYADKVSELDDADISAIESSAVVATSLISMANTISNQGGKAAELFGDNTLGLFAASLLPFGEGLVAYANSVSGVTWSDVNSSRLSIQQLIGMLSSDAIINADTDNIKNIQTALNELATIDYTAIATSVATMPDLSMIGSNITSALTTSLDANEATVTSSVTNMLSSAITNATTNADFGMTAGSNIVNSLSIGMSFGTESLTTTVTTLLSNISILLSENELTINSAGSELIIAFSEGMTKSEYHVTNAINKLISTITSKLGSETYTKFYNSGVNLVTGFANGITNTTFKAVQAAYDMATAAADAARAALNEQSPSRVGIEIGEFFGMGEIIGMVNMIPKIYDTGYDTGMAARDGMNDAISANIASNINANPVITPILDLSDVKAKSMQLRNLVSINNANATATMHSKVTSENQNDKTNTVNGRSGTVVEFTQINNSPKALTPTEIYRRTNNQLSQLKGVLAK